MGEKILIIDDDIETLKLIGLMLQRRGYRIVAAQGGSQGLVKAESDRPDLIILDIMMPDIDGFEVCRQLRANSGTADIPIIMFTAKTTVSDKVAGFQAGADDYLTKPIHPAELASRVEAVLQRSNRATVKPAVIAAPVPEAHARIVGLVGCKGGVGTTTLAFNVAVAMRHDEQASQTLKQIVLAELVTGMGSIGLQIGMTHQIGIINLLNKKTEDLTADFVNSQLTTHSTGIKLLLAPNTPRAANLPVEHTRRIIHHLAADNDLVLLDLGSNLDNSIRAALQMCHYTLLTIESQRVALKLAQALIAELGTLGIPHSNIGLVLINRAPSASGLTRSAIEEMLKSEILSILPPAPELAFQASENGKPLITVQPNSLVSTQIRELAHKIARQI